MSVDSHAAAIFRVAWSLLVRERPSEHLLCLWEEYYPGYLEDKMAEISPDLSKGDQGA